MDFGHNIPRWPNGLEDGNDGKEAEAGGINGRYLAPFVKEMRENYELVISLKVLKSIIETKEGNKIKDREKINFEDYCEVLQRTVLPKDTAKELPKILNQ